MTTPMLASRIDPSARDVLDELEMHVQNCLCGRIRGFGVQFSGHGLMLKGRTHSYYAKQLAQQAVMEASHLPIVANEIEVS